MFYVTTDASMLPKATQRDGLIVLPRLLKRSQREFEPENSNKIYVLQPLSVNDFLVHWRRLEKGDEVLAIHAHRLFEQTVVRAITAGRLSRPHLESHVFESLSSHSVRQIIDLLLQYRHQLTLDLADLILEQIKLETDSWFLQPAGTPQGHWWQSLWTRFQRLEWRTFDHQKNETHSLSWEDLLPDIYEKTRNRRVNVYITGYPSAAPAGEVVQEMKKWGHVNYLEITQLQVRYPHIKKLVIIECLPSKERIEMIAHSVFEKTKAW